MKRCHSGFNRVDTGKCTAQPILRHASRTFALLHSSAGGDSTCNANEARIRVIHRGDALEVLQRPIQVRSAKGVEHLLLVDRRHAKALQKVSCGSKNAPMVAGAAALHRAKVAVLLIWSS